MGRARKEKKADRCDFGGKKSALKQNSIKKNCSHAGPPEAIVFKGFLSAGRVGVVSRGRKGIVLGGRFQVITNAFWENISCAGHGT